MKTESGMRGEGSGLTWDSDRIPLLYLLPGKRFVFFAGLIMSTMTPQEPRSITGAPIAHCSNFDLFHRSFGYDRKLHSVPEYKRKSQYSKS